MQVRFRSFRRRGRCLERPPIVQIPLIAPRGRLLWRLTHGVFMLQRTFYVHASFTHVLPALPLLVSSVRTIEKSRSLHALSVSYPLALAPRVNARTSESMKPRLAPVRRALYWSNASNPVILYLAPLLLPIISIYSSFLFLSPSDHLVCSFVSQQGTHILRGHRFNAQTPPENALPKDARVS